MNEQARTRDRHAIAIAIATLTAALIGGLPAAGGAPELKITPGATARGLPSLATTTYHLNGERSTTVASAKIYDTRGNLIQEVHLRDAADDGVPESIEQTDTWTFDARGNLVEVRYLYHARTDSDGTLDACVAEYDRDHLASWRCDLDQGNDGSIESVDSGEYRYDRRGNVLEERRAYEGADGLAYRWMTRARFDDRGHRVESVTESDHDADGRIDSRNASRWIFEDGPHANELEFETVHDVDADGVPDSINTDSSSYDDDGRLVGRVSATDRDGDGIADKIVTTTHELDADGRPVKTTRKTDYDADGMPDDVVTTEFRRDSRGNVVEEIEGRDWDADGIVDRVDRTTRRFDRDGNLLSEHVLYGIYPGRDDSPHLITTSSYVYDRHGNLIEESHLREYRATTIRSYGRTTRYSY